MSRCVGIVCVVLAAASMGYRVILTEATDWSTAGAAGR